MANELNYYGKLSETGLTVTARVYNPAGTQVGADVTCVESGTLAIYRGDMPAAAAGEYGVRFFNGSVLLGQGTINWDGTKERLANLDATVSTRSTQASIDTVDTVVDAIKLKTDTLENTDLSVLNDISAADVWAVASRTLTDKTGFSLTSAERSALASAVESAILNEGDGQAVIDAIVTAIGNENITQSVLVAAIRADLERVGGNLDLILEDTAQIQQNQGQVDLSIIEGKIDIIDANVDEVLDDIKTISTGDELEAYLEDATTISGEIEDNETLEGEIITNY